MIIVYRDGSYERHESKMPPPSNANFLIYGNSFYDRVNDMYIRCQKASSYIMCGNEVIIGDSQVIINGNSPIDIYPTRPALYCPTSSDICLNEFGINFKNKSYYLYNSYEDSVNVRAVYKNSGNFFLILVDNSCIAIKKGDIVGFHYLTNPINSFLDLTSDEIDNIFKYGIKEHGVKLTWNSNY